jgi:hypothetical protein
MKQPKPGESREQRRQGAGSVRGGVTAPHQPMARLGVRDRSGVRPLPINEAAVCGRSFHQPMASGCLETTQAPNPSAPLISGEALCAAVLRRARIVISGVSRFPRAVKDHRVGTGRDLASVQPRARNSDHSLKLTLGS